MKTSILMQSDFANTNIWCYNWSNKTFVYIDTAGYLSYQWSNWKKTCNDKSWCTIRHTHTVFWFHVWPNVVTFLINWHLQRFPENKFKKKLPGSVTECQKTSIINCIPWYTIISDLQLPHRSCVNIMALTGPSPRPFDVHMEVMVLKVEDHSPPAM